MRFADGQRVLYRDHGAERVGVVLHSIIVPPDRERALLRLADRSEQYHDVVELREEGWDGQASFGFTDEQPGIGL